MIELIGLFPAIVFYAVVGFLFVILWGDERYAPPTLKETDDGRRPDPRG